MSKVKASAATAMFKAIAVILLIAWGALASPLAAPAATDSQDAAVYIISVEKAVEAGLSSYMERAFAVAAADPAAELVIVEIDTPGGTVAAAMEIRKTIEACPVETVALIKGGAISAGTYIAMSCDKIAMQPGTTIGDVEPRAGNEVADEKFLSYWRAEMAALAEARGRDKAIARAMVDRAEVIEGLSERGRLLTLTAQEAEGVGYADYIVANRGDLLDVLGLIGAKEVRLDESVPEKIARFVTNPSVAPFILMLGIAGIVIEVFTAGFGVAGLIGGSSLVLYFAGHMIAGFTGWGVVLLFLAGVVLLLIEAFIPGFGLPGISGAICLMISIILVAPSFEIGLRSFVLAIFGAAILIFLAVKILGRRHFWDRLTLKLSFDKEEGYISQQEDFGQYVGCRGEA
ncbi:MAG: ATP-dependent Clp protease proteolytic subunit, partial [Peptococcaceae bacterium]|nr:ATP-dependent Clp protease proteolytic subunit [Peptococcaceae bacterium]